MLTYPRICTGTSSSPRKRTSDSRRSRRGCTMTATTPLSDSSTTSHHTLRVWRSFFNSLVTSKWTRAGRARCQSRRCVRHRAGRRTALPIPTIAGSQTLPAR
eukprot:1809344-Rhodomonas_salina.2